MLSTTYVDGGRKKLKAVQTNNDEFKYHFEDIHRCQIKLIEVVPDKRVVWYVMDNYFKPGIFDDPFHPLPNDDGFDKIEWIDTKISFEISEKYGKTQIRFTHLGLVPEYECFDVCSNGWNHYIGESLLGLIATGKGQPNSTDNPMTTDEEKFKSAN
jgi:hypothetical protein